MATRTSVTQTEDASGFEVAVSRDGSSFDRQEMVLTDADGTLQAIQRDADNNYGTQTGIAPAASATLVTKVAAAGWRFRGFIVTGDSDADVFVQFDAAVQYRKKLSIVDRAPELLLPEPDADAGGTTVTLKITNTGSASGAYEGTLLGS